jgi:ABC-type phosphate transport system permease subunit
MAKSKGIRQGGVARSRWFTIRERLIEGTIAVCSAVTILGVFLILFSIVREAVPIFFTAEDPASANFLGFFGQSVWQPVSDHPRYSLLPLILGTAKITVIAMTVAIPIGVLAALYTAEFAPHWVGEVVKPFVELLAGIPSVVMGFFALIVLASFVQSVTGAVARLNAVNAGLALGLAIVPVVYSVSEDALRAVPGTAAGGLAGAGVQQLEDRRPCRAPGRFLRHLRLDHPRARPRGRRNHGRADGFRQRRAHLVEPARYHPDDVGHHRRRNGRSRGGG